jgi:hypothetical protein
LCSTTPFARRAGDAIVHRRERDAVLGIDGIDRGFNPDNVQEPGDLADHPMSMVGLAAVPAFIEILRVGQEQGR